MAGESSDLPKASLKPEAVAHIAIPYRNAWFIRVFGRREISEQIRYPILRKDGIRRQDGKVVVMRLGDDQAVKGILVNHRKVQRDGGALPAVPMERTVQAACFSAQ
jgi:hypothetical protein